MDVDTVEVSHLEAHLREGHMECLLEEIAVLRLVADDDELRCSIIVRQDREARAIVLEREFARALVRRQLRVKLAGWFGSGRTSAAGAILPSVVRLATS